MRLVELDTRRRGKSQRSAFNPLNIIKVTEADNGFAFLDTQGGHGKINNWTVYEPYDDVVRKLNAAMDDF